VSAPLKPDPWRIVVENGSLTLEVIRWKEAVREKAPHRFLSRGTAQAWIDRQEKEARTFEPMRSAGLTAEGLVHANKVLELAVHPMPGIGITASDAVPLGQALFA
jgi:hypothetical protein